MKVTSNAGASAALPSDNAAPAESSRTAAARPPEGADAALVQRPATAAVGPSRPAPRQPVARLPIQTNAETESEDEIGAPTTQAPATRSFASQLGAVAKSGAVQLGAGMMTAGIGGLGVAGHVIATGNAPVTGKPLDRPTDDLPIHTFVGAFTGAASTVLLAGGMAITAVGVRQRVPARAADPEAHELQAIAPGPGPAAEEPAPTAPPRVA